MKKYPTALVALALSLLLIGLTVSDGSATGGTTRCKIISFTAPNKCMAHCENGTDLQLTLPENRCTIGATFTMPDISQDAYSAFQGL